jgi:AcrR family transcriptional regulator
MVSDTASLVTPVREPKQGRSRASFEKALAAARSLLSQTGYEEFTLADVVKASGVSTGAIYGRVSSKDDLIRVVQQRVLQEMEIEQDQLLSYARGSGESLYDMLPVLLDGWADLLKTHAGPLRAFMLRAATDEIIHNAGRTSALKALAGFQGLILVHRDEIRHPDPERAVQACLSMAYAYYSRYLGLGTPLDAAGIGDWRALKEDVVLMSACFLQFSNDVRLKKSRSPATTAF